MTVQNATLMSLDPILRNCYSYSTLPPGRTIREPFPCFYIFGYKTAHNSFKKTATRARRHLAVRWKIHPPEKR